MKRHVGEHRGWQARRSSTGHAPRSVPMMAHRTRPGRYPGRIPENDLTLWSEERPRCTTVRIRSRVRKRLERIEDFQARATEVLFVAGDNREPVPPGCRGDVAVFDRHPPACPFQKMLLFRPDVRHRYVEPMDATVH